MDLKHLRYVVAVAREKNITKASEKLFISQSSLSYTLSTVEKEIGMPLFLRSKTGVELTPAGERYCEAARKIIDIYDNMQKELKDLDNIHHINIAASSVWGTQLFSDLIPKFRKRHPNVTFNLTQAELFYLEGELKDDMQDFAFLSFSPYEKLSQNMHLLRNEPLLLAVPVRHPYVSKNPGGSMTVYDLEEYFSGDTFLLSRAGSANRIVAERLFDSIHFRPAQIFEVNGLALTRSIVAQGDDVAFIPVSGCDPDANIHYYALNPPIYRYNVLLSKPLSNYNDIQKAFYKFVLTHNNLQGGIQVPENRF